MLPAPLLTDLGVLEDGAEILNTQWVVLTEVALNMLQPYARVRQEIPPFGPALAILPGRDDDAP
jgi:hypothetical protein